MAKRKFVRAKRQNILLHQMGKWAKFVFIYFRLLSQLCHPAICQYQIAKPQLFGLKMRLEGWSISFNGCYSVVVGGLSEKKWRITECISYFLIFRPEMLTKIMNCWMIKNLKILNFPTTRLWTEILFQCLCESFFWSNQGGMEISNKRSGKSIIIQIKDFLLGKNLSTP